MFLKSIPGYRALARLLHNFDAAGDDYLQVISI